MELEAFTFLVNVDRLIQPRWSSFYIYIAFLANTTWYKTFKINSRSNVQKCNYIINRYPLDFLFFFVAKLSILSEKNFLEIKKLRGILKGNVPAGVLQTTSYSQLLLLHECLFSCIFGTLRNYDTIDERKNVLTFLYSRRLRLRFGCTFSRILSFIVFFSCREKKRIVSICELHKHAETYFRVLCVTSPFFAGSAKEIIGLKCMAFI